MNIKQQGVSLIEVLIALVVFALGVVGMAGLQLKTLSLTMDSAQRTIVVAKSQDLADKIRSSGIQGINYISPNGVAHNINGDFCATVPVSCADSATADATACATAAQMVAFDLHDVFCAGTPGIGAADGLGRGSLENEVDGWQVLIDCVAPDAAGQMVLDATCALPGSTMQITTTWLARTAVGAVAQAGAPAPPGGGVGGVGGAVMQTGVDTMTLRFVP